MTGDVERFGEEASEGTEVMVPQRGRFQPGRSGNPNGRPRRRVREQSAIEAALDEQVMIKDAKGTRKVSAKDVIAKRLVQKAMAGDIPALKELQRHSPDFLKKIETEASKNAGDGFIAHLVATMSESASMEFRHALTTWEEKLREANTGGRAEPREELRRRPR